MRAPSIMLAILLLTCVASAAPPYEGEAIEHLTRALTVRRDGSHLPRIFSLRQLRDERLRDVLVHLRENDDWSLRVHGALGLAELNGQLQTAELAAESELVQEAVLANAIDMELITTDQLVALAATETLAPFPHLMVCAECLLARGALPASRTSIERCLDDDDDRARALARLLLAESGEAGQLAGLNDVFNGLAPRAQSELRLWMLEAVRQYRITAAAPWVESILSDPGLRRNEQSTALSAALTVDERSGLAAWERALGTSSRYLDRIRLGLVLLASEVRAERDLWATLSHGLDESDAIIDALVAAGRAHANGTVDVDAMLTLICDGTPMSSAWAMSRLEELPTDAVRRICTAILERYDESSPESIARSVAAASALFSADAGALLEILRSVPDNSRQQEALLLGLFEQRDMRIGEAMLELPRSSAGRADALALLLVARNRTELAEEDRQRLGALAAGGGRISDGLRTQAAWLYLVHTNRWRVALSQLIGG